MPGGDMDCGEKEIIGIRGSGNTFKRNCNLNKWPGKNSKEPCKQIPEGDEE